VAPDADDDDGPSADRPRVAALDRLDLGARASLDPDPLSVAPDGDPVPADRHPDAGAMAAQPDELVEGDPEFGRLADLQ